MIQIRWSVFAVSALCFTGSFAIAQVPAQQAAPQPMPVAPAPATDGVPPAGALVPVPTPPPLDHNAAQQDIQTLIQSTVSLANDGKIDELAKNFAEQFVVIMANGTRVSSINELKTAWKSMSDGSNGELGGIQLTLGDVSPAQFLNDHTAVVYGNETMTATWRGREPIHIPVSWTSTLLRTDNGWRIVTVQDTVDFIDNPVLTIVRADVYKYGFGGLIVGIVVGFIVGWMSRRKNA